MLSPTKASTLTSLRLLLNSQEYRTVCLLVLLMVISGFLDILGLGLVFPYITVLQDPEKLSSVQYFGVFQKWSASLSNDEIYVGLSVGLVAVFAFKGLFTLLLSRYQVRFVYTLQTRLGQEMFERYLGRPYSFFLVANASTLTTNLTRSINELCTGVIQTVLTILAEAITLTSVVAFLLYLSPIASSLAIVFVVSLAALFIFLVKPKIARSGADADLRWKGMLRIANEAINSIKEIQVAGRQEFFANIYGSHARYYVGAIARYTLYSQVPRVTLETGAIVAMVLFVLLALLLGYFQQGLFAALAVVAFATVRLVPSANRIMQAGHALSFYRPAVDSVVDALSREIGEVPATADRSRSESPGSVLPMRGGTHFEQSIAVSIRSFAYPGNRNFRLKNINLEVKKGERVAFIGHSGSGKTTLVDILLGLFTDYDGEVLVDGHNTRANLSAWRRQIGYIPQNLYLLDDTIARNVAFAIPDAQIDMESVKRVISLAGLREFVDSLANGLDTIVGDRGIRLSGGERQRIGIARALYHDPALLVLDEATSALDAQTERHIVDSILGLGPTKTIIAIAHRLNTVARCDRVYVMRGGRLVDQGEFTEVIARNPQLAGAGDEHVTIERI
jgi:ATP-binding cassette, subfamily B, bacterial PglK